MAACPDCGNENPSSARFCSQCGQALQVTCVNCLASLRVGDRFCGFCGTPVTGKEQGALVSGFQELELGAEMRRRLLTDIKGEHRLVTVFFADLTSSVKRTQNLHAEEATLLVNSLLEAMVEILVHYGGRIDRFLGDGLLAVFGIPETHEDDAERAVRAALDIQERAADLALGVTIGINTGRVYFGPVGSSLHEELTVMGPVVNLAARLQGQAQEGQILIGPATRSHVYSAFELTPVSLEIKGLEGQVSAYLVEHLLTYPSKPRGIEGLRARLVGRDLELEHLLRASQCDGCRFVSLVGEAGVGKSRLADEFRREFTARGGTWLEGRCLELTRELGYGPIRDLFTREFRSQPSRQDDLYLSVRQLIGTGRLPEDWLEQLGPFLGALIVGAKGDPRVEHVAPAQRKALTAAAVGDFLEAFIGDTPTVLFVDDLHWADELSIDLLAHLAPRLRSSPVLLLGCYRPGEDSPVKSLEERAETGTGFRFETLQLNELGAGECREMIRSLFTAEAGAESVEGWILAHAEGNPFYVEELVRSLVQKGLVHQEGESWSFNGELTDLEVPDSVQALVMSRLDRLDRPVQRTAQLSSVLGRSFTRPLVETLVGDEVQGDLDALTEAGIIFPEGNGPAGTYSFVHALSQQAVYGTLLPSRRTELHAKVAEILELLFPDEVEALTYHFERSRNHSKAVEYMLAAGEKAMDAFLTEAALGYLDRGLQRLQKVPLEDRESLTWRFRARRGEMLERLARHEEARSDLQMALECAPEDPLEAARLHRLIGQTHRLQGEFERAHDSYDEAERMLRTGVSHGSKAFYQAWIEVQKERAFALYWGGREDELPEHSARMAKVIESHGSVSQRIDHLIGRLLSSFRAHRFVVPPEIVAIGKTAHRMAKEAADIGRIAEVEFAAGFASLWGDELDEAEPLLKKAARDARRIGDVMLENRALSYHATCLRRLERPGEAHQAALLALGAARALEDHYYEGHSLANLCWSEWRQGNFGEARRYGQDACEAWGRRKEGQRRGLATDFAFLAVWPLVAMAVESGGLSEARKHLRYLTPPWERAMREELRKCVEKALRSDSEARDFREAIRLARREHLA